MGNHRGEIRIVIVKAKWIGTLKEVKSRKIKTGYQSRAWAAMGVDNQYEKNEKSV